MRSHAARTWTILRALSVLSGACSLAYEVVWGRWLVTILGGSALATGAVLSAYMGGLALGSWLLGRTSRRAARPLRVYAALEAGIALFALVFMMLAEGIQGMPGPLRFALSAIALLLPTTLMGGTIPLVMAWSEKAELPGAKTLGTLYGLNTIGAAAGCLATGFVLIPRLGLVLTSIVAVMGSLTIALAVFLRDARSKPAAPDAAASPAEAPAAAATDATGPESADPAPIAPAALSVVAFASGLTTLGLEVLWIRLLRITLGSTTYVFSLVVTTFILGIGLGGLVAARAPARVDVPRRLALLQLAFIALLLFDFLLMPRTPALFGALRAALPGWDGALIGTTVLCALVLFPAAFVSGWMFPLVGSLFMRRGHRGGEAGLLYFFNTIGAVVGALATTLVLIPVIGTARSFALLVGVSFVGLAVTTRATRSSARWIAAAGVGLLGGLVALGVARPGWTPTYLAHGAYLPPRREQVTPVVFAEGRSSTVLVERFGRDLGMAVDGKPEASTAYVDRSNQVLLGHLPALLQPRVDSGLVIGLGSGMTLGMVSVHGPSKLEVVELEARMRDAALAFGEFNHHVMEGGAATMIVDDGLNYLLSTDQRYDLITSDPIQPFFRGAAGLYTTEFFTRARARLTETGVMAHWLPLANMSVPDFKLIVRTFVNVFPYARLYWTGGFADTILVGRNVPWAEPGIDRAAFDRAAEDLRVVHIDSADEMDALLVADRDALVAWAWPGRFNEMDLPLLEFSAPRSLFANTIDQDLGELLLLRSMIPRDDPTWRAANVVLAYRANLEHMDDRGAADAALLYALGCTSAGPCEAAQRSGALRRILFERSMSAGDRALGRSGLVDRTGAAWWASPTPDSGSIAARALVEALVAYENAAALARDGLDDEAPKLAERAAALAGRFPPDSPLAARAAALAPN